ncbi:Uba3-binding protein but2 [Schizosaccharomyces pombe]|uniref:Uba3-binding protein but2 n=1 Tax=Schizosaccharomyces pombe (strain 972 / ATCC 24843) TaxID=284812 RepID=BUT2_SCHPO|nr:But2 family protein But2 [Schizosaccharomyces pombe]P87167.1 RecName: Full=Uba3-binding protein but2 [Schizosaccharomyces pombe 972h-]CAB09122.1 But2 family protein But2 [Schizosaccharomyces pombe]FAA00002.1 TPA: but2+ [Schizosaccharomyces pombe]|eukprot:NP_595513.1 But2 family protein But2 [Schizosaccharomyces pombe]
MQLLNSFLGFAASIAVLASSADAAPTLYKRKSKSNTNTAKSVAILDGVGVNNTFGVISYREKFPMDYHIWHTAPSTGKTYLQPWNDAVEPSTYYIDEGTFLRTGLKFAYIGDNMDLAFTNHTDWKASKHDDGTHRVDLSQRKPANNFMATQRCGKLDPFGYQLKRSKKVFQACGTQVFVGSGRSIDCQWMDSVALNLSRYYGNTEALSSLPLPRNLSADIPAKSSRLFPHGIYNFNFSAPNKRMQRFTASEATTVNGQNQSVYLTYDVPYGRSLYYYTSCALEFRFTNEFFPMDVTPNDGSAQFVVYNMSGNPKKQTTSSKGPTRLYEVARFNCTTRGCEYTQNIPCPRAGHSHTYELAPASPNTSISWIQSYSPRIGVTLQVYSNANFD